MSMPSSQNGIGTVDWGRARQALFRVDDGNVGTLSVSNRGNSPNCRGEIVFRSRIVSRSWLRLRGLAFFFMAPYLTRIREGPTIVNRLASGISNNSESRARTNKSTARRPARVRPEQHHTRVSVNRVPHDVGDSLVQGQQNTALGTRGFHHHRVRRTAKPFSHHRIAAMTQPAQILRKFRRKVLIDFERHLDRIGTNCSSCASSAAYASAASMCLACSDG